MPKKSKTPMCRCGSLVWERRDLEPERIRELIHPVKEGGRTVFYWRMDAPPNLACKRAGSGTGKNWRLGLSYGSYTYDEVFAAYYA